MMQTGRPLDSSDMTVSRPNPWPLLFSWCVIAALSAHLCFIPLVFPTAANGLFGPDAKVFHALAVRISDAIAAHGWTLASFDSAVNFNSAGYGNSYSDNVGIATWLGIIYAVLDANPGWAIISNAVAHAAAAMVLWSLSTRLVAGRTGNVAGAIAATLYVVFPSSLIWVAQPAKDAYANLGFLCIYWAWATLSASRPNTKPLLPAAVLGAGFVLLAAVRPQYLPVAGAACAVGLFGVLICHWCLPDASGNAFKKYVKWVAILVLIVGVTAAYRLTAHTETNTLLSRVENNISEICKTTSCNVVPWQRDSISWLPAWIDHQFEKITALRTNLILYGLKDGAGSMIDSDRRPANSRELIALVPRSAEVALFAPFPDQWHQYLTPFRLFSLIETVVWYLLAPGVLFALVRPSSARLWLLLMMASSALVLLGLITANIGTLHRIRYPFLFCFILVGAIGWLQLLAGTSIVARAREWYSKYEAIDQNDARPSSSSGGATQKLVNSGVLVTVVTAAGYGAFVVRDMLMARFFGLGETVARFQLAAFLPTFLASILGGSLYSSLVPEFARRQGVGEAWLGRLSRLVSRGFLLVGALAGLASVAYIHASGSVVAGNLGSFALLTLFMSAVLALSGSVVTVNALLGSIGHAGAAAAAQAVSPIIAIFVLLGAYQWGAPTLAVGALLGQVVNLFLARALLAQHGKQMDVAGNHDHQNSTGWPLNRIWLMQFLALVSVSVVLYAAQPLAVLLAERLGTFAVAAVALGGKTITLLNGLVWVTIAYVFLPYFSRIAGDGRGLARRGLTATLAWALVVSIPVTLLLFLLAPTIVSILFEGGAFSSQDAILVGRLTALGILQLPFFATTMLLVKFAVAEHRAWRTIWAMMVGLVANFLMALLLMPNFGVVGVVLGGIAGSAVATLALLIEAAATGLLRGSYVVELILGLGLFSVLVLAADHRDMPGIAAALLALMAMAVTKWPLRQLRL